MPTPVSVARQCLTEEAVRALDDAVAVARRRSHSQTTSLHAVSALLALPSSALRDACARARSSAYSSRLQFRALELCVGVSLDRLPSSKNSEEPPISNSLMAAIKRSQANQRRNPESFHLQQIHCNQQTASLLKVELKYLILSILDDPIVSRVFGEAGFRSCDIKLAIIHPPVSQISPRFSRSRCPPIFLCNLTDSGVSLDSGTNRPGLGVPFGYDDLDENCRRIGEVLTKKTDGNGKNPLLLGVCASNALNGFIDCVNSGKFSALPQELSGLSVVSIEKEINEFVFEKGSEDKIGLKFKEVKSDVERCLGPGIVLNFGELKILIGDDDVPSEAAKSVVSKITSLSKMNCGKLWLMGAAASYETYLKFSAKFSSIEKDWDLHLLPIHSKSSLMGSFVPFGGFFSSLPDIKNPLPSKNPASTCYLCSQKCEQEIANVLNVGSSVSVADQCSENLPSWLQMAEIDMGKGVNAAKTKDDQTAPNAKIVELQRKWNDICQRFHHSQPYPKIDISQTRLPCEPARFITHRRELGSEDPLSNESQFANLSPGNHNDYWPKNSPQKQNTSILLVSEPEKVNNFPPRSPIIFSSSLPSVTTDLGLGTIYASTMQDKNSLKSLQDHKEQLSRYSCSVTSEFDAASDTTSHFIAQSSSCSGPKIREQVDPRDCKTLSKALAEKVGCQDEAICTISEAVSRCRSGCGRRCGLNSKGDIWLSFLGPDRVGKKKIALALAEIIFGNRDSLICVDLSSQDMVSQSNSIFRSCDLRDYDMKFRGKNVVDYIAEEMRKNPHSVVFLENVDKADSLAQNSLSQAIRTGKFPDSNRREISINNMIFILTSGIPKGNSTAFPEKKCVNFSEETVLGAKREQMKILLDSGSVNKRKLTFDHDSTPKSSKWSYKRSCLDLNLNLPIDEEDEEDCNSGEHGSDSISDSEAWLEDFFDQIDQKVVFKPFNFDALAEKLTKQINQHFHRTMGSVFQLEIDDEVMIQLLAAAWLSEKENLVEDWAEKVLGRSFAELQRRYHHLGGGGSGNLVKLVCCEGGFVEEKSHEFCFLPSKIIV